MNENILVIEDDAEVRRNLSLVLSKEGYSVETVESGKQAIRVSEKSRFDVALIDTELPDMKGTELLHKLKEMQPRMVKIMVTEFPTLENAMKAINEGAEGYILKPLEVPKLLELVKKNLKRETDEHVRSWMDFDHDNTRESRTGGTLKT